MSLLDYQIETRKIKIGNTEDSFRGLNLDDFGDLLTVEGGKEFINYFCADLDEAMESHEFLLSILSKTPPLVRIIIATCCMTEEVTAEHVKNVSPFNQMEILRNILEMTMPEDIHYYIEELKKFLPLLQKKFALKIS